MPHSGLGNITTSLFSAQKFRHLASTVFVLMRVMHVHSLIQMRLFPLHSDSNWVCQQGSNATFFNP